MENIIPVTSPLSYFCIFQGFSTSLKNYSNSILHTAISQDFTVNQVLKAMPSIYHFCLSFLNFVHLFAGTGIFVRRFCKGFLHYFQLYQRSVCPRLQRRHLSIFHVIL